MAVVEGRETGRGHFISSRTRAVGVACISARQGTRMALALAAACVSVAVAAVMLQPAGGDLASAEEMLGESDPRAHAGIGRIAYAGIVPYVAKRSRSHPHAVVCGDESSVSCVLSEAADGLHDAVSSKSKRGSGKRAVEEAARGRGFAPWHVSDQSTAARAAARKAIARTGQGQGFEWIHSLWQGAENLDHEIDYGGRALPRVHHSLRRRGARTSAGRERVAESAISKTVDLMALESVARQMLPVVSAVDRPVCKCQYPCAVPLRVASLACFCT